VTVSQVAAPVLVHSEKFVIGALLGVAQLPYYSIPFSLVWTMTGVPASLGSVMFSRFARMTASGAAEESRQLAARVTRFTFAALLPAALFLIIHAEAILAVWMGAAFSGTAASSLRILTLAMLVNLAAWPTYQLLQASGRPDVPAKLHVIEVVGHLPLCILLVWHSGITGAALAWLTRVGFDTLALLWAGDRHLRTGIARDTIQAISRPLGASLLLMGPAFLLTTALEDIVRGQSLIILGLTAISYVGGAVVLGLAEAERAVVVDAVRGLTTQRPKGRSRDNVPSAKHPAE
jgi:O-antigen/teichoic acid export membrane protein